MNVFFTAVEFFIVLSAESWHIFSLSPLGASNNVDEIKQKTWQNLSFLWSESLGSTLSQSLVTTDVANELTDNQQPYPLGSQGNLCFGRFCY